MKKKSKTWNNFTRKSKILLFLFLGFFAFSQTKISGSVIDKTTGKPLSGVEIFINNKEKAEILTTSSNFNIVSDSGISTATFIKKNYKTEVLSFSDSRFENLILKMQPENVAQIQEVVLSGTSKKKYKNK